ncbi:MAG TPA: hypothetical protein VLM37_04685, partial [Fibrobacteraceae bacterium]|nr:hypothetical protein [Fibrobacteraceae bacterium]
IKSQRIQAFLGSENLSAQMVVDSLTLQQDSLEGGQSLWRGRLQWQNGCCLAASAWRVRGGFDLIGVSTSGDYPYRTDARVRALPWIALRIPFRGAEFSGWAGRNNDDWRWSDTLRTQWRFLRMEARTDAGTREQPLGMDEERLDSLHSICLRPSTGFWLQDLLLHTEIESGPVQIQISLQPWIQHGALAAWHSGDDSLQRISGRIGGLRKKAEFVFQPSERNSLHVGLTHENRQGDWDDLEWQPSQLVLWAGLECHLPTGMRIGHVWQYQSVMRWNTIADSSVHISGRWVWNAIVHQDFENGFELEANWIHVLLGGDAEVPGQNLDRTRFMCHLGWRF